MPPAHLNLEAKELFHIFNQHHQKWELYRKRGTWCTRCHHVRGRNIHPDQFEGQGADIFIGYPPRVAVFRVHIPDGQWFASGARENCHESMLKSVAEHRQDELHRRLKKILPTTNYHTTLYITLSTTTPSCVLGSVCCDPLVQK